MYIYMELLLFDAYFLTKNWCKCQISANMFINISSG